MPTWEQMTEVERAAFLAKAAERRNAREREDAKAEGRQPSQKGNR